MASSSSFTNDEIKHRIMNVYAKFVSDVEPDRLFDWLLQEHVITVDQKQRIRHQNPITSDRCRALLDHLFSIQHPRAFLVVRKSLSEDDHYLLEDIDNQEQGCGIRVQPAEQTALQAKIQEVENDLIFRSSNAGLRKKEEDLAQRVHQLETELESEKSKLIQLQKDSDDQKRAWEEEKYRLLKRQKELDRKLHLDKITIQQLEKDKKDKARAWEVEKDRLLKMPKELETKLQIGVTKQKKLEQESEVSSQEKMHPIKRNQELNQSHENFQNENYKSDPVLVQTIITRASKKAKEINGFTILDKELFVVNSKSSEVEVYDSIKFSFSRRWNLKKLNDPWDIGSCNKNKCLYIFDFKGSSMSNGILRIDPNGKLIKNWSTGNDCGWGLSITDESNVILTILLRHKLKEYSPDGLLLREINQSSDPGIWYPKHAIKLSNGNFVVSHGSAKDDLLRVWLIDEDGKLKKSFDGECVSSIGEKNYPIHLCVDRNGFVMVADRGRSRVLLLDSDLEFKREILSKEKHELQGPSRILLDESNGRLIVADNNMMCSKGQILFFDFK